MRIPPAGVIAALAVSALATLSNLSLLEDYSNALAGLAGQQRGGLAAVELARDRVDPGFLLTQENSDVDYLGELDAGSYVSAVDSYGSPAYSPDELAAAAEPSRAAADKVFAAALGLELEPGAGTATSCLVARPQSAERTLVLELPPGGAVLRAADGLAGRASPAPLRDAPPFRSSSGPCTAASRRRCGFPPIARRSHGRSGSRATGPVEVCRLGDRERCGMTASASAASAYRCCCWRRACRVGGC